MQLSRVTLALAAAGIGAGLAVGYSKLDAPALSTALAATPPPAVAPLAPTAAARLPDFTALAEKAGPAVVNISTIGKMQATAGSDDEDDGDDGETRSTTSSSASAFRTARTGQACRGCSHA